MSVLLCIEFLKDFRTIEVGENRDKGWELLIFHNEIKQSTHCAARHRPVFLNARHSILLSRHEPIIPSTIAAFIRSSN